MKELSELQEHIRTSMIDFHRKLSLPILPRQECKIKSIVIFTYLHEKYYNTGLPDEVYKELIHDGIGLIGSGDGWLTAILHRLFGWQPYIRSHGILHDAYGQFYNKYHRLTIKNCDKTFRKNIIKRLKNTTFRCTLHHYQVKLKMQDCGYKYKNGQ